MLSNRHQAAQEYTKLENEYVRLSEQIARAPLDVHGMKSLATQSYGLAARLSQMAKTKSEKNKWQLKGIEDILILTILAFNAHDLVEARRFNAMAKNWFCQLINPLGTENLDQYRKVVALKQHIEEFQIESFSEKTPTISPVNTEENSFTPTKFWINSTRTTYGNKGQAYYNAASFKIVNGISDQISQWVLKHADLVSAFDELLLSLAKERHNLAVETNTTIPERFGYIRPYLKDDESADQPTKNAFGGSALSPLMTPMGNRYAPCLYDIKKTLYTYLEQYAEDGNTKTTLCFGEFEFTIQILDSRKLAMLQEGSKYLTLNQNDQILLWEIQPQTSAAKKDGYICADLAIIIDGKPHVITTHFASFLCEPTLDGSYSHKQVSSRSLQDFTTNSQGVIFHRGDETSKLYLVKNIGELFKRAVSWDKKDPSEFKKIVAEMHYKLAHFVYCDRGSAAISEWIVKSLFKYHGYQLVGFTPGVMIDLKALAQPSMQVFIDEYTSYWSSDPASAITQAEARYVPCSITNHQVRP